MKLLFAVSALLGLSLVILAYYLRKQRHISQESARKLVHIAHAVVVSGWPVFFGYWFVIIGELIFVATVLAAQEYRLLHDLRQINRKTWGEFFLPLGVIWLAIVAPPTWVFVACLLLLGLSDSLAAIVGQRVKSKSYRVFRQKKTVAGTLAFVLSASIVMASVVTLSGVSLEPHQLVGMVVVLPLLTAVVENVSPYGSDNVTILVVAYFGMQYLGVFA